jgi:hypothetical protein
VPELPLVRGPPPPTPTHEAVREGVYIIQG